MRVIHLTIGLLMVTSFFTLAPATIATSHCEEDTYSFDDQAASGDGDADICHPDCEENQPSIIASTEDQDGNDDSDTVNDPWPGGPVFVCEGEHWDGHDPICQEGDGETDVNTNCDGAVSVYVADDWRTDDDQPTLDVPPPNPEPLRTRATVNPDGEVYAITAVWGAGQTGVYAGQADDGVTRVAWYGEDGTDQLPTGQGNILAKVVSSAGLTHCDPGEGDATATHDQYERTRHASDGGCTRDNTAITVEITP